MVKVQSLKGKLLLPLIVGTVIVLVVSSLFLANTKKTVMLKSGMQMADLVTKQSSEIRKIYAGKIMPKIQENGGYDHADWKELKGAVPAAATLVNMVGHNLSKSMPGVELRLYSEHPFKNRTLQLDEFEKRSLENFKKDTSKPYYEIIEKGDETFIKYAIADVMKAGCVKCHNSHPLTSKNDWKTGDLRGAVSATVPLTVLQDELASSFSILNAVILILLIILIIYVAIAIGKVSQNISKFKDGLNSFFSYVNKDTQEVEIINIKTKDEIGQMARAVNENITKTKKLIDQDSALIEEAEVVINRVKNGWYSQQIKATTTNESLNGFKDGVNEMIAATKSNFLKINEKLEEYSSHDYRNKLEMPEIEKGGVFDALIQDINKVRDSMTKMLKENKATGLTLDNSSDLLLENVDILNKNSNEASVSLEQTAAALEQITGNISSNTENIVKMSGYASSLTHSANDGQNLATKTTDAMDEINNEVSAINEAITVIDQISFQTNILSLNAAVEAATAGEAGKGFAVVAGEVRNLASRSAEAANEIKTLVQNATDKANYGKNISNEMIKGYDGLNDNISKTLELISDIECASKEQLSGIEQINIAVNSLDQQTQQNASIANKTYEVAVETDLVAKQVVDNVNATNFQGKDEVRAKNS